MIHQWTFQWGLSVAATYCTEIVNVKALAASLSVLMKRCLDISSEHHFKGLILSNFTMVLMKTLVLGTSSGENLRFGPVVQSGPWKNHRFQEVLYRCGHVFVGENTNGIQWFYGWDSDRRSSISVAIQRPTGCRHMLEI